MNDGAILDKLREHVDTWKEIPNDKFSMKKMIGNTNVVHLVETQVDGTTPQKIIFRQLNPELERLIHRPDEEKLVVEVGKTDLAPKILVQNKDYRIEEFFHGSVLHLADMDNSDVMKTVANMIYRFHRFEFDWEDKATYLEKVFLRWGKLAHEKLQGEMDQFTTEEQPIARFFVDKLSDGTLQKALDLIPTDADLINCSHNDLNNGNILRHHQDPNTYIFLDLEYSCPNFEVADIANYMTERIFDYEVDEPPFYRFEGSRMFTDEKKREFFTSYYSNKPGYTEEDVKDHVEKAMQHYPVMSALVHLVWTIWSLILVEPKYETGFHYLHYARDRFEIFQKTLDSFEK